MWSNLAVLFATGLLPFPTAVLAQALGAGNLADERIVGLYGAIGDHAELAALLPCMSRHPALLVDATNMPFLPASAPRSAASCISAADSSALSCRRSWRW